MQKFAYSIKYASGQPRNSGFHYVRTVFTTQLHLCTLMDDINHNLDGCIYRMAKTPIMIINSYNEGPIWGKFGCDIFALLGSYNGIGSAMNNVAIAYDRHR
jgi:r-opsin